MTPPTTLCKRSWISFSGVSWDCASNTQLSVQNKVLLYSLNNVVETLNGNLFVAIVETSCFIGTSFNIRAVLSGSPGRNMVETVGSTLLFYVLGQIIMIAFTFAFQKFTPYDDQLEAKEREPSSWNQNGLQHCSLEHSDK